TYLTCKRASHRPHTSRTNGAQIHHRMRMTVREEIFTPPSSMRNPPAALPAPPVPAAVRPARLYAALVQTLQEDPAPFSAGPPSERVARSPPRPWRRMPTATPPGSVELPLLSLHHENAAQVQSR